KQSPNDIARMSPGPAPSETVRPRFEVGQNVPGLTSWHLERLLGSGGFGEVWLVKHEWKHERRAVKFCTHAGARHRLAPHEKRVLLRVMKYAGDHPNIVPLLECNLDDSVAPWLMYEFVEGCTLRETVNSWAALAPADRLARAVVALSTLAGAIAHFH